MCGDFNPTKCLEQFDIHKENVEDKFNLDIDQELKLRNGLDYFFSRGILLDLKQIKIFRITKPKDHCPTLVTFNTF
jgi:hypothetical protein